ncbi:hypothetical protein [Radiobacillus deserti]|uniref:Uncharacterized protein n=1 Tax=Radiobacillus deserti TaxID=2594883 RepID=A0A516KJ24_9BACI|nr:hypothetical protein [Radiobacillus deserti]QDP41356.1 hypothetical protein FN924_14890 [Radiobacillus deserti]
MKRKKLSFYYLMMWIIVLSFIGYGLFLFIQPVYQNQPSMPNVLSMAMAMVLQQTRMQALSFLPMMDACHLLCGDKETWMPQHGNPILDSTNYILSILLVISTACLIGWVFVYALLAPLKQPGKKKEKPKGKKELYIVGATFILAILWVVVLIRRFPSVLKLDIYFWMYSTVVFLMVVTLVLLVIGGVGELYSYMRNQWFPKKSTKRKRRGGKSK